MASSSSSSDRRGPQIYVHVEFGVSWTRKPPKNHEITYKSRNLRERTPNFPRQVPAPNTNYLAAIHDFDRRQTQVRQGHRVRTNPEAQNYRPDHDAYNDHQLQEYYQVPPPPYGHHHQTSGVPEQSRLSRAESRSSHSSHERGHSAPPPIGENPWDVNFSRGREDLNDSHTSADQWKALPAEPSQFRLGEGGMPWSAWSWPFEYQPDTPSQEEVRSVRSVPAVETHQDHFATSPTMVSTFSPEPSATRVRDKETGRTKELGQLSAAMMTVDNGFENQWWNQGPREVVPADEPAAPATQQPLSRAFSTTSAMGWSAVDHSPDERYSLAAASIVSPMTANSDSPTPAFQSLHRSLSTRSEELFFMEGR